MNILKNEIFGNTSIILHENEIREYKNKFKKLRQDSEKEKLFDQEVKTILLNSYNGVGVVVPIQFNIPLNYGDVITKEILSLENDATKKWGTTVFNNIYAALPTKDGYEVVINY